MQEYKHGGLGGSIPPFFVSVEIVWVKSYFWMLVHVALCCVHYRAVCRLFIRGVTFVTTPKPLVHACSCFLLFFTRHISGRWSKFVLLQKDLFFVEILIKNLTSKHACQAMLWLSLIWKGGVHLNPLNPPCVCPWLLLRIVINSILNVMKENSSGSLQIYCVSPPTTTHIQSSCYYELEFDTYIVLHMCVCVYGRGGRGWVYCWLLCHKMWGYTHSLGL